MYLNSIEGFALVFQKTVSTSLLKSLQKSEKFHIQTLRTFINMLWISFSIKFPMTNFTFKQIWTLCLDFPESFSDLLFKKISENVFLKRSEHWFLTSKSLKVLFLNCCLWQTIIAIICKILWFASLSQKMVVIVMINYLQKSKKKPFS